ncbi:hypothetical protein F5Y10DRAFT_265805 [Nemania abortiva]|nr:hypothetical protein F5Y10DRAFT_265805 [Nemania abortiva]
MSHQDVLNPDLEEKVNATVHTFMALLWGLRSSAADSVSLTHTMQRTIEAIQSTIERNTGEAFWWTSWVITFIIGVYAIVVLGRLRNQLEALNAHQIRFRELWEYDQENDANIRREEFNERRIQEARNYRTPQEAAEAERTRHQLHEMLRALGPIPPIGTAAYDGFLLALRTAVNNQARDREGEEY